ncbi:hypothetical protein B0H13DRAFT_185750 [Mycena leptocephala]|nr:hypothetical protein B0H13DRAFT_185750 [Mycena leptocephala]
MGTTPESTLLWLHGSAGVGKSAIAQMFAGTCKADGRLGGSFFFRRGHSKRGTWNGLFTTLSFQLATSQPGLRLPIEQVVESDTLIDGKSMAIQFQRLIVEPFMHTSASQPLPIIILDGLDECEDRKIQQQILHLFTGALHARQLPIRMLISSRPEPHLREVLESQEICGHFNLSPDEAAYADIRTYLWDEFSRIHSEYKVRGIDLGSVWPPQDTLDHLVMKSSGMFIYAATVIRFVDSEYSHPMDRLESVLNLDPQSTAPLDDLYTQILSVGPQEQQQLRILHIIWRGTLPYGPVMNPEDIDIFLNLRLGTCRLSLRGVHSLLDVPPISGSILLKSSVDFMHASFADYLGDARRSGQCRVATPAEIRSLLVDYRSRYSRVFPGCSRR